MSSDICVSGGHIQLNSHVHRSAISRFDSYYVRAAINDDLKTIAFGIFAIRLIRKM